MVWDHVDWVRFPAPRKKHSLTRVFFVVVISKWFLLHPLQIIQYFLCMYWWLYVSVVFDNDSLGIYEK